MKSKIILTVGCLLVALWVGATVLPAEDNPSEEQPGLQSAANDSNDSPPTLERLVFIHYRKGHGNADESPGKEPSDSGRNCYGFVARGLKWRTLPVNYTVGLSNQDGLSEEFLSTAFSAAASQWDDWTGAPLFDEPTVQTNLTVDPGELDGVNAIAFGDLDDPTIIAITILWYLGGPVGQREILDWGIVLNDADFTWGDATTDSTLMDVQNIATHELGHALGLNDVYQSLCSEVTMYGYSYYGDLAKRTLEAADITGLRRLYGK